jgi:DnaJ-class molecular chaperone
MSDVEYAPLGATWLPPEDKRKVSRCPICNGTGKVPDETFAMTAAAGTTKPCHTCYSRGIVWPP